MSRIVIIGNSGGGKSTLARKLAEKRGLPFYEIDRYLWDEGWRLAPAERYAQDHARLIGEDSWVIDGLGSQSSIAPRIERATEIILIDMPLWMHFWLAAERHVAWAQGRLDHKPGNISTIPPLDGLFKTIWDVDQTWMPKLRSMCAEAERAGKTVARIASVDELNAFSNALGLADAD